MTEINLSPQVTEEVRMLITKGEAIRAQLSTLIRGILMQAGVDMTAAYTLNEDCTKLIKKETVNQEPAQ